jgi:hypothetical protein
MVDKVKAVEKMIETVMQKKDLSRNDATYYMLAVATGRLAALWRYDKSLAELGEGKTSKGILVLSSPRKKRAPKSPKILPSVSAQETPEKPARKRPAKKRKPAADSSKPANEAALQKLATLKMAESAAAE